MTCLDLILECARVVVAEVGAEAEDAHEDEGDQAVAQSLGVAKRARPATLQIVQGIR